MLFVCGPIHMNFSFTTTSNIFSMNRKNATGARYNRSSVFFGLLDDLFIIDPSCPPV
jgi:hypothetical protein